MATKKKEQEEKRQQAASLAKQLDNRPRRPEEKITMQEIVEEVRAVRRENAEKAAKNISTKQ